MTTVYLIRHGEAVGNLLRQFQGRTDMPLTETGRKQAEQLARRFRDIHLDAVYSSPLSRALDTAKAANASAGLPITLDDRLQEINVGDLECVSWDTFPVDYPEKSRIWETEIHLFEAPNGESTRQVSGRMRAVMGEIVRCNQGKAVAVASHGCAIRTYLCYALGYPFEQLPKVPWCDNTAVTKILYDEGLLPRVEYMNDTSHLTPETAAKPVVFGNDGKAGAEPSRGPERILSV